MAGRRASSNRQSTALHWQCGPRAGPFGAEEAGKAANASLHALSSICICHEQTARSDILHGDTRYRTFTACLPAADGARDRRRVALGHASCAPPDVLRCCQRRIDYVSEPPPPIPRPVSIGKVNPFCCPPKPCAPPPHPLHHLATPQPPTP